MKLTSEVKEIITANLHEAHSKRSICDEVLKALLYSLDEDGDLYLFMDRYYLCGHFYPLNGITVSDTLKGLNVTISIDSEGE